MMTKRQSDALHYIKEYMDLAGKAPTAREIAKGIKARRRGTIPRLLAGLQERGFIRLVPGRKRNIVLIDRTPTQAFRWDRDHQALVPFKDRH